MKKLLTLFCCFIIGSSAFSQVYLFESNVNMENFWEKNGRTEQKVTQIGYRIMNANKLNRAPIVVEKTPKVINAFAMTYNKTVYISSGILPYIDSDDEMAAILSHELAHSMEAYGGPLKLIAMSANSKKFEKKADLTAVDYMVNAGYNPIAIITISNKIFDEPLWDWGFLSTHPKGSTRLLDVYAYIYVKYPQYLNSPMTKNIVYQNFLNSQSDDIKRIEQKQKLRKLQNEEI